MAEQETKSTAKSKRAEVDAQYVDGDPEAEPGTTEHLGSDRPYEGYHVDPQ